MPNLPFQIINDDFKSRKIRELKVRCQFVDTGCKWEGKLNDLKVITMLILLTENESDKMHYNIPRACLLNRSPDPAMDLKSIRI